MTEYLKKMLHDFGLLHVTIHYLEEKQSKDEKITIEDYDKSLGEIVQGEPLLIVKISKEGKSEIADFDSTESSASEEFNTQNIKYLQLPEDEYYFFESFRLGIFNLEQEIPNFIHGMWIIHSYGLFEFYLMRILRSRFQTHPKMLSKYNTLIDSELMEDELRQEHLERLIELEVRNLLFMSINQTIGRMRQKLGFEKLPTGYDCQIQKISLIRNCLAHNAGHVSKILSKGYSSEFKYNDILVVDTKIVDEVIHSLRKFAYEVDKVFKSIKL